jgi:hypothetical protein
VRYLMVAPLMGSKALRTRAPRGGLVTAVSPSASGREGPGLSLYVVVMSVCGGLVVLRV